mmetsp:Transcript_15483/g.25195  ORF Transcript_15483/g.25195 Transcript_15483/m.25195 type:complete len:103 (+) Transcript_15483:425-733(+)
MVLGKLSKACWKLIALRIQQGRKAAALGVRSLQSLSATWIVSLSALPVKIQAKAVDKGRQDRNNMCCAGVIDSLAAKEWTLMSEGQCTMLGRRLEAAPPRER